ncbi:Putative cytosolic Fe-S cluster assembly factor [Sarcoptes scabiei]|nr:Putative cytosolic Fe-S cluster assembly factor [Sarcoptes scabiei]
MSGFSSTIKLADLNDFIRPSQVCVKSNETIRHSESQQNESIDSKPIIRLDKKNEWKERKQRKDLAPETKSISITLGDCLACSGCITSAEEVLILDQSYQKVLELIESKKKGLNDLVIVFSLSLQTLASFAAKFNCSLQSVAEHLAYFLHDLGVDYVFDLSLARHICLVEYGKELNDGHLAKPLISSTCPGFVCYAEKSQGDLLLPYLSNLKSPQQIMGLLVKRKLHLADPSAISVPIEKIYHVSLMPCFDKKLEASRVQNRISNAIAEVDCVLTPIEIEKILDAREITDLTRVPKRKLDTFSKDFNEDSAIYSHIGSGSGGYADNLIRLMLLKQKYSFLSDTNSLDWKANRNADFLELFIYQKEHNNVNESIKPILSFAILNGFRNIQNLVNRLKRKNCHYDFIEVSACPKGCLNGGAQFKDNLTTSIKQSDGLMTQELVETFYHQLPKTDFSISHNDHRTKELYDHLGIDENFIATFRTNFKAVTNNFNLLNSEW